MIVVTFSEPALVKNQETSMGRLLIFFSEDFRIFGK